MVEPSHRRTVTIGPVCLDMLLPDAVEAQVRAELEPFLVMADEPGRAATLRVELVADRVPASWSDVAQGESVAVDTSRYRHLASAGLRFPVDGGYVVHIQATGTHVFFAGSARRVVVHQPDPRLLALDGIRTIKSLVTVLAESAGGVQLHSSAVTLDDGRGVLVLGDMWQGKTTLLLELLSAFRVRQLSCDTVVVFPNAGGGLGAHGWPSPFSVSHGSLSDHPELAGHFPQERRDVPYDTLWREGMKAVLTSGEVVRAFGTGIAPSAAALAHCIVTRFRSDGPVGLTRLTEPAAVVEELRTVYLGSRDPIYHDWHGYVPVDDELIRGNLERIGELLVRICPVTVLTWAPSATSLLKRIPELGSAHKHLGTLLSAF